METFDENIEMPDSFDLLDDLGNASIEQIDDVQPIEIQLGDTIMDDSLPDFLHTDDLNSISFRGGNCKCSCDMSCIRGY